MEDRLDQARVLALVAENAFRLTENLRLLERGQLTCLFRGGDVTEKQMAAHVKSLVNLETILAEFGHTVA